jgi:hypothetical protein
VGLRCADVVRHPGRIDLLHPAGAGQRHNTAGDEFYPITFTGTPVTTTTEETTTTIDPGTQVPEVPMNVLLPLGAAAVIGGAVIVSRRRANAA